MANVVTKKDVGNGLGVEDNKLVVKAGSGITVDENGVSFDPSVLPTPTVDIKLSGLTFTGGKLKGILSDGSEVTTDFNSAIVLEALKSMNETQKAELVGVLLPEIVKAIKGDIVQDFGNTTLGYLLKTDI